MTSVDQAAILCGGLGTRLRPHTNALPKPMIPVNGRPFLECLIEQLREQGIRRVLLLTGYRGEQIEGHFGDGSRFGVEIGYSRGPVEWDTGRRLWEARPLLSRRFLLLYSDNFAPFSLAKSLAFHDERGRPLSLMLCARSNGNISLGAGGIAARYDHSRTSEGLDLVEVGYMIVERDPVFSLIDDPDVSFSRVLERLAASGDLAGHVSAAGYYSISDPERWKRTEEYLRVKRILLVDRDGTLGVRPPKAEYVHRWEDFQWAPGALAGLEKLSDAGFSFVMISNQAGIARGMLTTDQVEAVNQRLMESLEERGIRMHKAYVCPHHWDEGCTCRKPLPGLLYEAARDFALRLDRTFYLGDDTRDCQAAYNANCASVFIGDEAETASLSGGEAPACVAKTVAEAAPWIISRFESWEAPNSKCPR